MTNLTTLFCIIGWWVFWLTMLQQSLPAATSAKALTPLETHLLDELVKPKPPPAGKRRRRKRLVDYFTKVTQLESYLARASNPPPGNLVMWRGLTWLNDIQLSFTLATKLMGN